MDESPPPSSGRPWNPEPLRAHEEPAAYRDERRRTPVIPSRKAGRQLVAWAIALTLFLVPLMVWAVMRENTAQAVERARGRMQSAVYASASDEAEQAARFVLEHHPEDHVALHWLGQSLIQQEKWAAAEAVMDRQVALFPGDALWQAKIELSRAEIRMGQVRWFEAERMIRRSLSIGEQMADTRLVAFAQRDLGWVLQQRGVPDGAIEMYRAALKSLTAIGEHAYTFGVRQSLAALLAEQGDDRAAEDVLRQAMEIEQNRKRLRYVADAAYDLAWLLYDRGELAEAITLLQRGLGIYERRKDQDGIERVCALLGYLLHQRGDIEEAEPIYRRAIEIAEALDRKDEVADSAVNLAGLLGDRGDALEAEAMLIKARDLYRELGMDDDADEIQVWIDELR